MCNTFFERKHWSISYFSIILWIIFTVWDFFFGLNFQKPKMEKFNEMVMNELHYNKKQQLIYLHFEIFWNVEISLISIWNDSCWTCMENTDIHIHTQAIDCEIVGAHHLYACVNVFVWKTLNTTNWCECQWVLWP